LSVAAPLAHHVQPSSFAADADEAQRSDVRRADSETSRRAHRRFSCEHRGGGVAAG